MARKGTIKLLLINESENESERLVSLFRNAGRVARTQRVNSADSLLKALTTEPWDLLIANDKHPEVSVAQCLTQLKKLNANIPALILREDHPDNQKTIHNGAADVIPPQDDARLVLAADKELERLEQRQQLIQLEEKLHEAEKRCKLLLTQSQEAIGYVSDGMLIKANPLFAECFGYSDAEDLDCTPIIDLIDEQFHNTFKGLLKAQIKSEDSTNFSFKGHNVSGELFPANMRLSHAVIDGENCVQLTVHSHNNDDASTVGSTTPDTHPETGLCSNPYFLHQLDSYYKQAKAGSNNSTLLFIGVDQFSALRIRLGIATTKTILAELSNTIQSFTEADHYLAHYCDDGFTLLLPNTSKDNALSYAEQLCRTIEAHIIELAEQSIQCTVSIGLLSLENQNINNVVFAIDNSFQACEEVRTEANNNGLGNGCAVYTPIKEHGNLHSAKGDEELDNNLAEALEDNHFTLFYQPIVSLRGSAGEHYEVQLSVPDDEGKLVSADSFISSLNFQNMNTRLDRWVIIEATKQLSEQHQNSQDIHLVITLTRHALYDDSLAPWLGVALKAANLPPQALVFQFTEDVICDNLKPAIAFAETLKNLGCYLSISNFGQIDNPFNTLKHVNTDFVKLTQKFTTDLESNGDTQALKAMVSSISEAETKAVIPYIQRASDLATLWQIGADYIQGDYLAPPTTQMNYEFTDIT